MVTGAFASIGGDDSSFSVGGISLWSYDDDLVQKGIAKVEGAGDALADIATGVKAFEGFDSVAVATSIGTLLTSIGTTFSTLYETNPEISPQLQDFATFIVTLGDVAEKGLLDKAAEGISKIADSINSIDIDKTVAFGDLFKHSADLSTNKSAYKKLAQAVEDIRDMMESTGGGGGGVVDKVTDFFKGDKGAEKGADGAAPAAKGADSSKQLNATLASLSKAITNLPMSIATMELTVSPR
jgi:hypothetical protein